MSQLVSEPVHPENGPPQSTIGQGQDGGWIDPVEPPPVENSSGLGTEPDGIVDPPEPDPNVGLPTLADMFGFGSVTYRYICHTHSDGRVATVEDGTWPLPLKNEDGTLPFPFNADGTLPIPLSKLKPKVTLHDHAGSSGKIAVVDMGQIGFQASTPAEIPFTFACNVDDGGEMKASDETLLPPTGTKNGDGSVSYGFQTPRFIFPGPGAGVTISTRPKISFIPKAGGAGKLIVIDMNPAGKWGPDGVPPPEPMIPWANLGQHSGLAGGTGSVGTDTKFNPEDGFPPESMGPIVSTDGRHSGIGGAPLGEDNGATVVFNPATGGLVPHDTGSGGTSAVSGPLASGSSTVFSPGASGSTIPASLASGSNTVFIQIRKRLNAGGSAT